MGLGLGLGLGFGSRVGVRVRVRIRANQGRVACEGRNVLGNARQRGALVAHPAQLGGGAHACEQPLELEDDGLVRVRVRVTVRVRVRVGAGT